MTTEQIDWSKVKFWQVWDPIPFQVLDQDKLVQILAVQIDFQIQVMEQQIEHMRHVRKIVAS